MGGRDRGHDLRLGVLTPLIAGAYANQILDGIATAAGTAGARVVAVQTLDPWGWGMEARALRSTLDVTAAGERVHHPPVIDSIAPDFDLRLAWSWVDGFLVVLGAVPAAYLRALQQSGKPVVLVSDEVEGVLCPVVRADNRTGILEAVSHLVSHGHRRIGFAGSLHQADIRDRLAAYREALATHGIETDERLVFAAGDNLEGGGEAAGRRILDAGVPTTAVVCANDFNAIGVARVLRDAGLRLPEDQAITGFDDVDVASSVHPALTTVRQSPSEIGRVAAGLMLRMLRGDEVAPERHVVPALLIRRESCGCSPEAALAGLSLPLDSRAATPRERLRGRLERLLVRTGSPTDRQSEALERATQLIVEILDRPEQERARSWMPRQVAAALCAVDPRQATITAAAACVRRYWEELGEPRRGDGERAHLERSVAELTAELARAVALREAQARAELELAMDTEHDLTSSLFRASSGDPRTLAWLEHTRARGGCLGLWPSDGDPGAPSAGAGGGAASDPVRGRAHRVASQRVLTVAGCWMRDGGAPPALPARVSAEAFPPQSFLAAVEAEPGVITALLRTTGPGGDLGILALAGRVGATRATGPDRVFDKGALLGAAIEREVTLERLRRYNDDLGTFSQAMAHDLRNPLATISMWASLAASRAGPTDPARPVLDIVERIREVAGYAGELVGDLLRYAELERRPTAPERVDLNLAAGRALSTLEAQVAEQGALVETGDLPTVMGSFSGLELILQNLISNAIRHAGERPPRIRVDAVREGPAWTVRCRDNGAGIPDEVRERVFEPFVRSSGAVPGSGLGLATCRRIVQAHGGRIWIEESGARGTTVAFTLPVAREAHARTGGGSPARRALRPSTGTAPHPGRRPRSAHDDTPSRPGRAPAPR